MQRVERTRRPGTHAIADLTRLTFIHKGAKQAIPDDERAAKIGVDLARVAAMVNAVMRRCVEHVFFGCPVLFEQPRTLVSIPLPLLGLPLSKRDPMLKELLERQAQALLDALPDPNAFDQSVQQLLARLLPEGQVSVDKVAASLHQSTRTLQRRLADSGLSWQELLDRTREQLACGYLRDHGLSLAEIALLLGYSEQSAFTRSFKLSAFLIS